jgi:hypothetical protein
MRRRAGAIIAAGVLCPIALAFGVRSAGAAGDTQVVAKVYGCPAEDSCTIDYKGDRFGRGVWVIRKVAH